jgi:metallo-beta-lactamase class B
MSGKLSALAGAALLASACSTSAQEPEPATAMSEWIASCADWDEWDKPGPPFKVFGNTWYVGTCGIGAVLVTGDDGHVLIDSGTEAGAEIIAANISALGFKPTDVKLLLHSHEHFDHVGGMAKMKALTGAELVVSEQAAPVFESGEASLEDPQHGLHDPMTPVKVDRVLGEDKRIALGNLRLGAMATPGHTPGALTWQWESCEGETCLDIVYADSLSPISSDDYRFSEHAAYVAAFMDGLRGVSTLECDILLTPHPSASGMRDRILEGGSLRDATACLQYSAGIMRRLSTRLSEETGATQ